jgi:hypothetical protein
MPLPGNTLCWWGEALENLTWPTLGHRRRRRLIGHCRLTRLLRRHGPSWLIRDIGLGLAGNASRIEIEQRHESFS